MMEEELCVVDFREDSDVLRFFEEKTRTKAEFVIAKLTYSYSLCSTSLLVPGNSRIVYTGKGVVITKGKGQKELGIGDHIPVGIVTVRLPYSRWITQYILIL